MAILRTQYSAAFKALEIIENQIVKANEDARGEDVDELEQVEAYLRKYLKSFASNPD